MSALREKVKAIVGDDEVKIKEVLALVTLMQKKAILVCAETVRVYADTSQPSTETKLALYVAAGVVELLGEK